MTILDETISAQPAYIEKVVKDFFEFNRCVEVDAADGSYWRCTLQRSGLNDVSVSNVSGVWIDIGVIAISETTEGWQIEDIQPIGIGSVNIVPQNLEKSRVTVVCKMGKPFEPLFKKLAEHIMEKTDCTVKELPAIIGYPDEIEICNELIPMAAQEVLVNVDHLFVSLMGLNSVSADADGMPLTMTPERIPYGWEFFHGAAERWDYYLRRGRGRWEIEAELRTGKEPEEHFVRQHVATIFPHPVNDRECKLEVICTFRNDDILEYLRRLVERIIAISSTAVPAAGAARKIPTQKRKSGMNDGTREQIGTLLDVRENSINHGRVNISRSRACGEAKVIYATMKKNAPELFKRWDDPNYKPTKNDF